MMNVDYFGATTPTDESTILPPPPPGKTPLSPSLDSNDAAAYPHAGPSTKGPSPPPSVFDALAIQPRSGSPSIVLSAPPARKPARGALSSPQQPSTPTPTSASRPPSSSTPVPLLPPPGGYRFAAAPAKLPPPPSAAQFSPESTPLALLIDREKRKDTSLPAADTTPPPLPPVKGTGGLTAQDLSFFEGL